MTQSEKRFEQFCETRQILYQRVAECDVRTPDYEITVHGVTIAVEVKQIEPNDHDRALLDELAQGRAAGYWVNSFRARQSILHGVRQLRAHVKGQRPAMVVLYELTDLFGYLQPDSIADCLYGPQRVHIAVPHDPRAEPWMLGASYGGCRVATQEHNTTLSAVAVLQYSARGDSLTVFHNAYAALPIKPERCRFNGVRHFAWRSVKAELLPYWVDVTDTAA